MSKVLLTLAVTTALGLAPAFAGQTCFDTPFGPECFDDSTSIVVSASSSGGSSSTTVEGCPSSATETSDGNTATAVCGINQ